MPPQNGAQLTAKTLVEFLELTTHLGFPEVSSPAQQHRTKPFDHVAEVLAPASPKQHTYFAFEASHRLRGDLQLGLQARGERVAQELAVPRPVHRALVSIDCQTQAIPEEPLDGCQHTLARTLGPHIDIAVVGVADKAVPTSLQFLVQLVEQDVG